MGKEVFDKTALCVFTPHIIPNPHGLGLKAAYSSPLGFVMQLWCGRNFGTTVGGGRLLSLAVDYAHHLPCNRSEAFRGVVDYISIRHGIAADEGVKVVDFDAKRLQGGDGRRVVLFDNDIAQGVLFTLDGRVYRGCRGEDYPCIREVAAKFAVDADSAAIRSARYAITGTIPIVGNALSGALSVVAGGVLL